MSNDEESFNNQLVLVCGESGSGKSVSLMNLEGKDRVLYLNCETGKRLPFNSKFTEKVITDPWQVYEAFEFANGAGQFDTIVIDSLTYLMDMYESQYVLPSNDTQKAWGEYAQFYKNMMQTHVAQAQQAVVFTAHTQTFYDEQQLRNQVRVAIKGAVGKGKGAEADFSTVVATKKVPLKELDDYQNNMLNITEDDEMLGYKHVFQTRLTKSTVGERIRSPMGMFSRTESFMDNDVQLLLDHLKDYYA